MKAVVKRDYIFVLGDNGKNKIDSRYRGFIPIEKVLGRVEMITLSFKSEDSEKPGFKRIGTKINNGHK